jgi:hypothetical protein
MSTRRVSGIAVFALAALLTFAGSSGSAENGEVAQSAVGGGQNAQTRFAFRAFKTMDGLSQGRFSIGTPTNGASGQVACMGVEGNQAMIIGIVETDTWPFPPGSVVFLMVTDNGVGPIDPPDTFIWAVEGPGYDYTSVCGRVMPEEFPPGLPVIGNIEVRDYLLQ